MLKTRTIISSLIPCVALSCVQVREVKPPTEWPSEITCAKLATPAVLQISEEATLRAAWYRTRKGNLRVLEPLRRALEMQVRALESEGGIFIVNVSGCESRHPTLYLETACWGPLTLLNSGYVGYVPSEEDWGIAPPWAATHRWTGMQEHHGGLDRRHSTFECFHLVPRNGGG
jgi:hypothetical protein